MEFNWHKFSLLLYVLVDFCVPCNLWSIFEGNHFRWLESSKLSETKELDMHYAFCTRKFQCSLPKHFRLTRNELKKRKIPIFNVFLHFLIFCEKNFVRMLTTFHI